MVQPVSDFLIICKKCEEAKKIHSTLIYINWEKRYYLITCQQCNTIEAFDELANKIESLDKVIEESEDKNEIKVN